MSVADDIAGNLYSCNRCGLEKTRPEFPTNKKPGGREVRHTTCRECRREQCRAWAKSGDGKLSKRSRVLRAAYGIIEDDFEKMHQAQGGVCAICSQPETKIHWSGKLLRLSVDHDHSTGKVRALLCQKCNVGVGCFLEKKELLESAIRYLERFKAASSVNLLGDGIGPARPPTETERNES